MCFLSVFPPKQPISFLDPAVSGEELESRPTPADADAVADADADIFADAVADTEEVAGV